MAYYKDKKGKLVKLTDKAFEKRDSKDLKFVGQNLREAELAKKPTKKSRGKS